MTSPAASCCDPRSGGPPGATAARACPPARQVPPGSAFAELDQRQTDWRGAVIVNARSITSIRTRNERIAGTRRAALSPADGRTAAFEERPPSLYRACRPGATGEPAVVAPLPPGCRCSARGRGAPRAVRRPAVTAPTVRRASIGDTTRPSGKIHWSRSSMPVATLVAANASNTIRRIRGHADGDHRRNREQREIPTNWVTVDGESRPRTYQRSSPSSARPSGGEGEYGDGGKGETTDEQENVVQDVAGGRGFAVRNAAGGHSPPSPRPRVPLSACGCSVRARSGTAKLLSIRREISPPRDQNLSNRRPRVSGHPAGDLSAERALRSGSATTTDAEQ